MFDIDPNEDWNGGAGWDLVETDPIKAEAPYTFFTPSKAELALLQPGDRVQVGLAPAGQPGMAAERLWVQLSDHADGLWHCHADETRPSGAPATFDIHAGHIWAVGKCRVDTLEEEARYLANAFIDPAILTAGARVSWLQRCPPPMRSGPYAETGWCAYGPMGERPLDQLFHGPIGLLLNKDDSMMALLRAPVGARITRWSSGWRVETD